MTATPAKHTHTYTFSPIDDTAPVTGMPRTKLSFIGILQLTTSIDGHEQALMVFTDALYAWLLRTRAGGVLWSLGRQSGQITFEQLVNSGAFADDDLLKELHAVDIAVESARVFDMNSKVNIEKHLSSPMRSAALIHPDARVSSPILGR